jgi:hypothetical protein
MPRNTACELSGQLFVEAQTQDFITIWKSSRPKPRNKAMGFNPNLEKTTKSPRRHLTDEDFNAWWKEQ